jgi:hypothetical protein
MRQSFSLLFAVLAIALPLRAAVSPIHMAVEQSTKTEMKPKALWDKTQVRSLTIRLTNNSAESFDGLVVKYWFFGRDVTGQEVKVLNHGERKSSLTPRGKDFVESETVSSSYVEAHSEISGAGSRGRGGGAAKRVPASGQKILGYAVQVLQGGKVLAETYNEPSYKQRLAEAPAPAATPAAAPKKKKQ